MLITTETSSHKAEWEPLDKSHNSVANVAVKVLYKLKQSHRDRITLNASLILLHLKKSSPKFLGWLCSQLPLPII